MTTRDSLHAAETPPSIGSVSKKPRGETKIDTSRRTAIIIGVLFLVGYVGVFLGASFYAPILDAPDYLLNVFPNRTPVITGMGIELINDVAVIGIAVLLFPILKKHSEGMALGLVAFRFMEAVMLIISKISVLSLITLSQEFLAAGGPDASYFQTFGAVALSERHWASQMSTVFFILGALVFYVVMYQSRLLPRFISVFGLLAVASLTAANVLDVPDPTQGFQPATILYLLIFLSELFVALWLIVKGFDRSAMASLFEKEN